MAIDEQTPNGNDAVGKMSRLRGITNVASRQQGWNEAYMTKQKIALVRCMYPNATKHVADSDFD